MNCPKCESECDRDEADVGVGVIHGPWGCWSCGWSEDSRYDSSAGTSEAQRESGDGRYIDPCGGSTSIGRLVQSAGWFGIPAGSVHEVFKESIMPSGNASDVLLVPQEDRMMKWFAYEHLPEHLKVVSVKFYEVAASLCAILESGPERTVALRKLLEAKDAAVRSRLHPGG